MIRIWKRRPRYSEHIDYLLASIVYLGTNKDFLSRTPSLLAAELSLDESKLVATFTAFPGIFRRSKEPTKPGLEYPYALQARYALKVREPGKEATYPPLPTETLRLLYDFVQKSADEERTGWRTWLSLGASAVAALFSALVAFYVATEKPERPPAQVCLVDQSSLICTRASP